MNGHGYWERLTRSRISRRRAIIGAGTLGAGATALSLVGCSGDSNGSGGGNSGPVDTSGLLYTPVETTKQAQKGGTLLGVTGADVTSFDPLSSQSFTTQVMAGWVYSRLMKMKPGVLRGSENVAEGDIAESWEISDDKLQITMRLRQNMKWDARAPTSGRPLVADDVIFSWKKFVASSPLASALAHEKSADSPIESMTAPDSHTVVIKLAFPDAGVMTLLGSSALFYVMPMESDGQFDPRNETRGSSAWYLDSYKPSGGFTYARNPNWYRSDVPFVEKADYPIVPEYSSGLAQFRAGHIYSFGVKQEDIISTKRDISDLLLYQGGFTPEWYNSWFGYEGNSPFRDKRVRQAWSMSYDRDLWIQTMYATEQFDKIGLPVSMRWHSHVSSASEGWWVDPQDEKAFGPNAKYFQYNPDEAKKLLSAAGYPNGVDVNVYHISTGQYLLSFPNQAQIQIGFAADVGFRPKIENPDYQTVWLPKYYYGKGGFNGIAIGADRPEPDIGNFMFQRFHPAGTRFKGFDPSGTDPRKGDSEVTKMIDEVRQEFDTAKRKEIAKRYQQYMAEAMYDVPFPGLAAPFNLVWPCLGNAGVYRSGAEQYAAGTETAVYLWIDSSKPPISQAT